MADVPNNDNDVLTTLNACQNAFDAIRLRDDIGIDPLVMTCNRNIDGSEPPCDIAAIFNGSRNASHVRRISALIPHRRNVNMVTAC